MAEANGGMESEEAEFETFGDDVDADGAGANEEAEGPADVDGPLEGSLGEHTSVEARSGRPRERLVGRRPPRRSPFCQVIFGKRRRLSASRCWCCS